MAINPVTVTHHSSAVRTSTHSLKYKKHITGFRRLPFVAGVRAESDT